MSKASDGIGCPKHPKCITYICEDCHESALTAEREKRKKAEAEVAKERALREKAEAELARGRQPMSKRKNPDSACSKCVCGKQAYPEWNNDCTLTRFVCSSGVCWCGPWRKTIRGALKAWDNTMRLSLSQQKLKKALEEVYQGYLAPAGAAFDWDHWYDRATDALKEES